MKTEVSRIWVDTGPVSQTGKPEGRAGLEGGRVWEARGRTGPKEFGDGAFGWQYL